jgi:YbbR domain-containing protein
MQIRKPQIRKNYKPMIGMFVLAFLLWFMVKMNRVYEYSKEIPIQFANLDPDKIFMKPLDEDAVVEFTGKGIDLLRLNFYDVNYRIDLSGAPEHSEFDLSQHPEYVNFPAELEVQVKSILRPRTIPLDFDEKVSRKIPVLVDYELAEPAGHILVDVNPEPDSVLVTGPERMFEDIQQIFTEKKRFEEPSKAFTEEFAVRELQNYYAQYDPEKVEVTFNIQRLAEKVIEDVPVTIVNKPGNLQVIPLPSNADIYVKGGEKILAELDLKDFEIVIDFRRGWRPGVTKVRADLKTQADVLYMESRPPLFELVVQKKSS